MEEWSSYTHGRQVRAFRHGVLLEAVGGEATRMRLSDHIYIVESNLNSDQHFSYLQQNHPHQQLRLIFTEASRF